AGSPARTAVCVAHTLHYPSFCRRGAGRGEGFQPNPAAFLGGTGQGGSWARSDEGDDAEAGRRKVARASSPCECSTRSESASPEIQKGHRLPDGATLPGAQPSCRRPFTKGVACSAAAQQ